MRDKAHALLRLECEDWEKHALPLSNLRSDRYLSMILLDPLQIDLAKKADYDLLLNNIQNATSLEKLLEALRKSKLHNVGKTSLALLVKSLEEWFYFGVGKVPSPKDIPLLSEKIASFAVRHEPEFMRKIEAAGDLNELLQIVDAYPGLYIDRFKKEDLIRHLEHIAFQSGNGIQQLPRVLRQKVRDLVEARNLAAAQRSDMETLPHSGRLSDPLKSILRDIDDREAMLLAEAGEYHEAVYQVLERRAPLEKISRNNELRQKILEFMQWVVRTARLHFSEMNFVTNNPYTGEQINRDDSGSLYRLAKSLLNGKAGRPIMGAPSLSEEQEFKRLIAESVGVQPKNYNEARQLLRREINRMSPDAVQLLKGADRWQKAMILETYFGDFQHRDMPSIKQAFEVAKLFGLAGLYREVGVTVVMEGGALSASISLGDLGSVAPEDFGRYFVMHTHPEEYLTELGKVEGYSASAQRGKDVGRIEAGTVGLHTSLESHDSRNILPSQTDLKVYLANAKRYRSSGNSPKGKTALFDPETQIYKNWVFHPFGGSVIEIDMDGLKPTGIKVRYYRDKSTPMDQNYKYSIQSLKTFANTQLKLPIEIQEVTQKSFEMPLFF